MSVTPYGTENVDKNWIPISPTVQQWTRNIVQADAFGDSDKVAKEVDACVTEHLISLQKVETVLRSSNCWSYLIARKYNGRFNGSPSLPLGVKKTYYLFIYVGDEAGAMKEINKESTSYDDNFQKLLETGFLRDKKGGISLAKPVSREDTSPRKKEVKPLGSKQVKSFGNTQIKRLEKKKSAFF